MKNIIYLAVALIIFSCKPVKEPAVGNQFPKPEISGGKPLMIALRDRQTTRDFNTTELSMQQISNLLWAANGINRPLKGKHTAPSSRNKQEIDIYVAMKSGVYLFNADKHELNKISDEDVRLSIGEQKFHKVVPLELILVADYSKVEKADEDQRRTSAINSGYISQNIYLFCASENLATVAVGWVQKDSLAPKLHLRKNQEIIIAHPIGYKK
jgi:SagB-type dehydrogenase family enzyme